MNAEAWSEVGERKGNRQLANAELQEIANFPRDIHLLNKNIQDIVTLLVIEVVATRLLNQVSNSGFHRECFFASRRFQSIAPILVNSPASFTIRSRKEILNCSV